VTGENKDAVLVNETEIGFPRNVHEALKRLGGVAQTEGHGKEIE
jgi:hypothetical protein